MESKSVPLRRSNRRTASRVSTLPVASPTSLHAPCPVSSSSESDGAIPGITKSFSSPSVALHVSETGSGAGKPQRVKTRAVRKSKPLSPSVSIPVHSPEMPVDLPSGSKKPRLSRVNPESSPPSVPLGSASLPHSNRPKPSSSNPEPTPPVSQPKESFLFGSKSAAKRYKERFSFRRLHIELNVVIKDFPVIHSILQTRQWENSLVNHPMPSQNLVREFYANMDHSLLDLSSPNKFTVFCRGQRVHFAPSVIRQVLCLPLVKDPVFNADYHPDLSVVGRELTGQDTFVWNMASNDFPTTSLTWFYRVLHKLCLSNWFPNSHSSSVTLDIGRFLYAVGTGVSIDLATVMFDKIMSAYQSKGKRLFLPFACLIHRIALHSKLKITNHDVFLRVNKLDKAFHPRSSDPIPPPSPHPYPLLREFDPTSWKFKVFEMLYVHQHKLEELESVVTRSVQRHKESQRQVLAQLAQIRQSIQDLASASAHPPTAPISPSAADAPVEGEIPGGSVPTPAHSQGESSSSADSDDVPTPPRALMKGRKTVSMLALPSSDQ